MKYQYTIEKKIKNAPWYHLHVCNSIDDVIRDLYDNIKDDKRYKRIYYVYNDFFKNVYPEDVSNKKYRILCRPVGDWSVFENNLNNFD